MKFESLAENERKLLLTALEFKLDKLNCQQCGVKVSHADCGIMPPFETKLLATILCDSALCMAEYLTGLEDNKNGN